MPQMANITVKKADGTTDITYVALSGAGGDGMPAVWRAGTTGAAMHRPTFAVSTRWNGPKTARRVVAQFTYPEVVSSGGVDAVANRLPIEITGPVPMGMSDAAIAEAVAQAANLFKAALIQEIFKTGFSAN